MLKFLYTTVAGRFILKGLTNPAISNACGKFLDSRASRFLIPIFVKSNKINLSEYYADDFECFNDCFTRKVREACRPVDMDENALIAPCDGLLTVYPIQGGTVLPVKQSGYSIRRLLRSGKLAERYRDGICLVYRLCVDNYHRYCYLDDGIKGDNHFIPGRLHTVRPIALLNRPVFTENCREYTLMKTANFGVVLQMEVGALLVGKICNNHGEYGFSRGEEKGYFKYGGSTIIVLLEKDKALIDETILNSSLFGEEYPVRMGQKIGIKAHPTDGEFSDK